MAFDAAPRLTRSQRDAARGKLAKMRGEEIARRLAQMTRAALAEGEIITPLNREAVYRHTLRRVLILQGWHWQPADNAAARVVEICLELVQAKRPAWNEGQPEHVTYPGLQIERLRCANCHKPLEEHQHKFCSKLCRDSYSHRLRRWMAADDEAAARYVSSLEL